VVLFLLLSRLGDNELIEIGDGCCEGRRSCARELLLWSDAEKRNSWSAEGLKESFRRPLEAGVDVATLDFLLGPFGVLRTFGKEVARRLLGDAAKLDLRLLLLLLLDAVLVSAADGRLTDRLAFLRARLVLRLSTEFSPNSSSPSMARSTRARAAQACRETG
jgi:hypothetical protein